MEKHHCEKECLHVGLKIAKLALKTATVVAAFMAVHELCKVHKSLEHHLHKH